VQSLPAISSLPAPPPPLLPPSSSHTVDDLFCASLCCPANWHSFTRSGPPSPFLSWQPACTPSYTRRVSRPCPATTTLLRVQGVGPLRWACSRLLSSAASTSCTSFAGFRSGCAGGCRLSPLRRQWLPLRLGRLVTSIAASAGRRALVTFSLKIAFLQTRQDDCMSRLRDMLHKSMAILLSVSAPPPELASLNTRVLARFHENACMWVRAPFFYDRLTRARSDKNNFATPSGVIQAARLCACRLRTMSLRKR
jgi:hypothetical protein